MSRVRFFRFRDRASYKPSEVLGLFVVSLFGGMILFGICVLVDQVLSQVFS
jgi:hypothetical protein